MRIKTPDAVDADERRDRERRGRSAERLCRLVLQLKGYRILAHRFRCPAGEIDIVARRGDSVTLVEVKARPDRTPTEAAVSVRQWRRIHAAARFFIAQNPAFATTTLRFDLMIVTPGHWPRHLENAWQPSQRESLRF